MRRRQGKKTPIKKLFIVVASGVLGCAALYLFFVGLSSILSFIPEINTDPEIEVVETVSEGANVSSIKALAREKNIIFDSVVESSRSAVIIGKIKEGPEVYFAKSKEAKFQMDSLQIILSKLTIDNKEPKVIDMRYTRPIVKF